MLFAVIALSALATRCENRPLTSDVSPGDATDRTAPSDTSMDGPSDDTATMDATVDGPIDVQAPPVDAPTITDCANATGAGARDTSTLGAARASIVVDGCLRRYRLEGPAPEREPFPNSPREWAERADAPRVRTRNVLFDALYSLAVEESRLNSVDAIRDGAFNNGAALPCPAGGCFETGQLWNYVWTRDTAYSVDLGLAAFDPVRARNSLAFKLSARRDGSNEQIVQDTGTGGSYPVSTDRVAWALGADALIPWLDDADRGAFDDRSYNAIRNTAEHDRLVAFDPVTGLYRGEQSFLDWREQSYPEWTARDNAHIAMSHSLGTNLLHWAALDFVARGATARSDASTAARYTMWRDELAARIRARFWIPETRTLAAFTTTTLDPSAVRRLDLLATSLAVSLGVLSGSEAADAVANYPFSAFGPPVIHPQLQQIPIYHNRGAWPFVTAYLLRAARDVRNDAVANAAMRSLMEGAARSRTHAENFEFVTGRVRLEDGPATGPVVNSPRQLWSVAGYLGAVESVIFGLSARGDALRVRPYITGEWRRTVFDNAETITLEGVRFRGATLTVELALPPLAMVPATVHSLSVQSITVDGAAITGDAIPAAMLPRGSAHRIRVQLQPSTDPAGRITRIGDTSDYRRVFGPRTPEVTDVSPTADGARLRVSLSRGGEMPGDVTFDVYRNGERVATGLAGSTATWEDPMSNDYASRTYCYTVSTTFAATGTRSQHGPPRCYWGRDFVHVHPVLAYDFVNTGGTPVNRNGRFHVEAWGDNGHTLEIPEVRANATGTHLLQVTYSNGSGGFSTGITCAVKRVTVFDIADGREVARGTIAMPQTSGWDQWRDSTFVRAELTAGRAYRVLIGDGPEAVNMSAFRHFNAYTGGTGGMAGAFNRVNIAELRLLPMEGLPRSRAALVALDGERDFDDFAPAQRAQPGIRYDTWDHFALDWDDDYLYLAMASPAFESTRERPLVLYLQSAASPAGAPRQGLTYSMQTPTIPFAAEYAILLRRQSDLGDGAGPFNGIFRFDGARWRRVMRFVQGRHFWVGSDMNRTLSARISRAQLGLPTRVRLAGHVITGGSNYNDVLPSTHTPWTATGGGHFEIDLTAASRAATGWIVR
jgi:hypothetical protein